MCTFADAAATVPLLFPSFQMSLPIVQLSSYLLCYASDLVVFVPTVYLVSLLLRSCL